ncbi:MAG TPA: hypothetical protein VFF03_08875 [Rhodocyclaceae bacterium]|nr:hypothetical protein [Rhodocyclaceae bacterium]
MNSVGSLAVSARYVRGALDGLEVRLERPSVTRLFLGQTPEFVARTVPCLYTLCAKAQGAACRAALAAAQGEQAPWEDSAILWIESLHEHFWRLLLDWPLALGLPQAKEAFVTWRAARSGAQVGPATAALLENTLLGLPAAVWREEGGSAAEHSLAGRCLARLEHIEESAKFDPSPLTAGDWLAYWRDGRSDAPSVGHRASIGVAWLARLREAVDAALALEAGAPYPMAMAGDDGWGIGQAITARGILTHGVRIEDGRVAAYRVWAPTDRHFADAACLAALLQERTWPDLERAQQALEQAVLALDPCLPYTVKVDN